MYPYTEALRLIKTFEGFNERAYADPETGAEPYTLGYGTQFYPDGTPVKQGHCVTKEKAMEYLVHEVETIAKQLFKLNLGLDHSMINALISFVHSIGWDAFLYSNIIDRLEEDDYGEATQDMSCWIFDIHHQVIGGLIDRRRHEIKRQCANAILEASIQEEANEYLPATNHASIRLIIKSAYVFT